MASKKFFIKKRNFLERDTLEIEAVGSLNQTHGTLRIPKRALTYISSPKSKLIFCLKTGLISTILVWVKNLILAEEFLIQTTIFSVPAVVFWQSEESERSQNCWFSFYFKSPFNLNYWFDLFEHTENRNLDVFICKCNWKFVVFVCQIKHLISENEIFLSFLFQPDIQTISESLKLCFFLDARNRTSNMCMRGFPWKFFDFRSSIKVLIVERC